jgi:hypothetical protein
VIRVERAVEPATFDAAVRQPGLRGISELVGALTPPRRGRPRTARGRYASPAAIPSKAFTDYWTRAIPALRECYKNLCAYLALYIEKGVGAATVDHFVPKSKDWSQVYEWDNYRLCAAIVNGTKSDREIALDPFTLEPGIFALEFTEYQVVPGPRAEGPTIAEVDSTCEILGLNLPDCREARAQYVADYLLGPPEGIAIQRLEIRAPFIAQELRRQGLLVRGDT